MPYCFDRQLNKSSANAQVDEVENGRGRRDDPGRTPDDTIDVGAVDPPRRKT